MAGDGVLHPQKVYLTRLEQVLQPGMSWLDIGCGRCLVPRWLPDHRDIEERLSSLADHIVGVDLDLEALRANSSVKRLAMCEATFLPFISRTFDLVTSNMVFEHIERPRPVLEEIRRVTRPGGRLLVHTPNIHDIVTVAARLIPNRLHPGLVSCLEGRAEEDVYPTHFFFNRAKEIRDLLRTAGFEDIRLEYLDHPNAYGHIPLVAQVEALWHCLARRIPALRGTLLIHARV